MPNLDEILLGENFLQQVNKINALIKVMNVTSGMTPSIGDNGNWFIGEIDTGLQAQGPKGNGIHVANASNYETIKAEMHVNDILLTTENIQSIVNIKTNTIGSAPGDLYKLISDDTYEFLGSLIGPSGEQGPSGIAGITPHIGDNGNWFIGDTDTGVAAGGSGGSNVPFVAGTQTAATGAWTGVASTLTELKDGQTIHYWLPYAGSGNATLNLTLADEETTTGAKYCYYRGGARLNTQFSAGSMITLTYRKNVTIGSTTGLSGWWASGADDTDTNTYVTQSTSTSNANYRVLLSGSANDSRQTGTVNKSSRFTANPYTGALGAPSFVENGTALSDKYAPTLYRHLIKITYSDTNYTANATLTIISKDAGAYGLSKLNTFLAENGYLMTGSTLNSIMKAEGYPAIGVSIANGSTYYMVKSVAFDKSVGGSFLVAVKSYNANITQSANTLGLWVTDISDTVTVI